jgi:hypothetical protein
MVFTAGIVMKLLLLSIRDIGGEYFYNVAEAAKLSQSLHLLIHWFLLSGVVKDFACNPSHISNRQAIGTILSKAL